MGKQIHGLFLILKGAARDLFPVVLVIGVFQTLVLRQPFPDLGAIVMGLVLVLLGLALFMRGLEMGLFPLGESMAQAFARRGSMVFLFLFSFFLGFGTTIAEPALIAIADEAAKIMADAGHIDNNEDKLESYAFWLRATVAVAVGAALLVGVLRIILGWSLPKLMVIGYLGVMGLTAIAPEEIIGIAYDSGGVTTSTITVPLVTALGVGLASSIRGRNPLVDGFGLIALASLTPMMFVMIFGLLV